ncbi:MAG: acetamidase/formamidase family protein [Acidobacteria bacterium]|nr:acetamidase/formamidase family protein [Acidobacteriota bacterium]
MRSLKLVFCLGAASLLWGQAQHYAHSFSAAHPVFKRVRAGETVTAKMLDAGGQDETGARPSSPSNPLTGPFFVEGAEPGDALLVHIRRLRMNRNWGWSSYRLGLFSLTAEAIEGIYPRGYKKDLVRPGSDNYVPWDIDLARNRVRLREPVSRRAPMEFAARPMLGCIGVAAPGEFAPTSGISGPYGGNMDYNRIGEGATVLLPVYHPGGLLFVGDGHAVQADGEPAGTGVETSMEVEFTVEIRKRARLTMPRVITAEYLISVGSQPEFASSLDRALQMATADMAGWLTGEYGLEPWAAHLLIGMEGRYDVVTVAGSMALRIPKSVLPK